MSNHINIPWVIMGDFNEITSQSKKLGGKPIKQKRVDRYLACMNTYDLHDVGFIGNKITCTNKRKKKPIFQRLYRAWVNLIWLEIFPDSCVFNLP